MKTLKQGLLIAMAVMLIAVGVSFAETARLGSGAFYFNPTKKVAKTAAYTVLASDSQIEMTATNANLVVTLPTIASVTAGGTKSFKIIKKDATAYKIVVTPASGDTIGGESTRYLVGDESYMVIHSGPGKDWTVDYESPYIVEDHEAGTYTTGIGSGGLFVTLTDNTTLTGSACGNVYAIATDAKTIILPATIANCKFTFINSGAAGNNILALDPNAADQIFGTVTLAATVVVISDTAGDRLLNTKASSQRGDSIVLVGDGVDGWYIASSTGIWAEE